MAILCYRSVKFICGYYRLSV